VKKINLAYKAIKELGIKKIWFYSLYQLGLRSGYFRWIRSNSKHKNHHTQKYKFHPLFILPEATEIVPILGSKGQKQLLKEANNIVDGKVRIFSLGAVPLKFISPFPLEHWTKMTNTSKLSSSMKESNPQDFDSDFPADIKFLWEPCRFGWVFTLGRAFLISKDEKYAAAFWNHTETFLKNNPPNMGIHWVSSQEVALRLMALSFGYQIFQEAASSTKERRENLINAMISHADRIPPTIIYARAQNNNHLLSEASGLITAGYTIPDHPRARQWRKKGFNWFNKAVQNQIDSDGAYMQHSTNYHRLILQLSLWVSKILVANQVHIPQETATKLYKTTKWLNSLLDNQSGKVPNLGPNDGAYILPFSNQPFEDFRPVLKTALYSFCSDIPLKPEAWDEMIKWIGEKNVISPSEGNNPSNGSPTTSPAVIHSHDRQSWAYLRAAKFKDRPGHADQLHFDLWWRGMNIAQDAGTYLYNAEPPWDNAFVHTPIHNTITIDDHDQMTPVGRFLFLDWAQAKILSTQSDQHDNIFNITAQHDGYRHLGLIHTRQVNLQTDDSWLIEDKLIPSSSKKIDPEKIFNAKIHWLLPDWQWKISTSSHDHPNPSIWVDIHSPEGMIRLSIQLSMFEGRKSTNLSHQLIRAGNLIHGEGQGNPTMGWFSATYGKKFPALSFSVTTSSCLPIKFISKWTLPSSQFKIG